MCMPSFGPPKTPEVTEMMIAVASLAVLPAAAPTPASSSASDDVDSLKKKIDDLAKKLDELAHKHDTEKEEEKEEDDEKKEEKEDEEAPPEEAPPEEAPPEEAPPEEAPPAVVCATKPYGQCAGMNFTQTKVEKSAYNVSAGAAPLSCCPEGTSCVTFGPVWGMCMPAWVKRA